MGRHGGGAGRGGGGALEELPPIHGGFRLRHLSILPISSHDASALSLIPRATIRTFEADNHEKFRAIIAVIRTRAQTISSSNSSSGCRRGVGRPGCDTA